MSVKDHLGNEFESIEAMCKAWLIPVDIYQRRIDNGATVEMALYFSSHRYIDGLTDKYRSKMCIDPIGDTYLSITAMCESWGIDYATYKHRLSYGWTMVEALVTPIGCRKRHSLEEWRAEVG